MKKKSGKTRIAIKVEDDLINAVKNIKRSESSNDLFGDPEDLFSSEEGLLPQSESEEEEEILNLDPEVYDASSKGLLPRATSPSEIIDLDRHDDKTIAIASAPKAAPAKENFEPSQHTASAVSTASTSSAVIDDNKTVAVAGMAKVVDSNKPQGPSHNEAKTKVSYGAVRASARSGAATAMTSPEAAFLQADNLRIAQSRISELEKELERVRTENEELASAGETLRLKSDDLQSRLGQVDQERKEAIDSLEAEIHLVRNSMQYKEIENRGLRAKVEELEGRLSADLKKIRLRERELENRLELLKMERTALVQSKDEALLDLKRKMDQLKTECDNYRNKCQELNKTIDQNQEQVRRTVRALRLALTNLEVGEDTVFPIKKAD